MKLTNLFTSAAIVAVGVNGLAPDRQVVITYPNETPKHVLDDAKASIIAAEGKILHEFELLKGFLVRASAEALSVVSAQVSVEFQPVIEDDGTFRISKS